jgi:hypothetical protein
VRLIAAPPARRCRDYAKKIAVWGALGAITRGRLLSLSLMPPLLKMRLMVTTGADTAVEFDGDETRARPFEVLVTSILLTCIRVGVAPNIAGWCDDVLKIAVRRTVGTAGPTSVRRLAPSRSWAEAEVRSTNGGGQTMQAVIAGSPTSGCGGTTGMFMRHQARASVDLIGWHDSPQARSR